jgi:tripartite-type tricarboxylate transporter receptor subunit TctC
MRLVHFALPDMIAVHMLMANSTPWLAYAQAFFPDRAIKLLTAGAPGSVPDSVARPLAHAMAQRLGQPVVVENRPGAGGILAINLLAKAPPDGYTIGLVSRAQMVYNVFLFEKLTYDPLRDLTPVINLVAGPGVVAFHASFPANSLEELIALAKARPATIHYAIPQFGSPPHILALRLCAAAQIDMVPVPYRGSAESVAAVVAGEVPVVFDAPFVLAPQVKAGKLKAVAVTGRERSPLLPDVPTIAEIGFTDLGGEAWLGLAAPVGVPPLAIAKINNAASAALRAPALRAHFEHLGWRVLGGSSDDFASTIIGDHASWGPIIRNSGVRLVQ